MPRWLLWTLLAIACWGVWAVIPRAIGTALSAQQQQALCTIGLLPLLLVLAPLKEPAGAERQRRGRWVSFAAGICSSLGNLPFFTLLAGGAKTATVVPLAALYPVVTVTLAVIVLKERLNIVQSIGFVMSLAAIFIFNDTSAEIDEETAGGLLSNWLLLALVSIGLWGIAGFLQKVATNDVSGGYSALWFHLAFIPIGGLLYYMNPLSAAPSSSVIGLVVLLGLTLAIGNLAVLAAFACGGRAAIITPLAGLYPLISLPLAVSWFHETISPMQWCGIALALLAVAMLTYELPVKQKISVQPAADTLT